MSERTLEQALAHADQERLTLALSRADTWRNSAEAKGERYVELLYDDTVRMINDLVTLADETQRLHTNAAFTYCLRCGWEPAKL